MIQGIVYTIVLLCTFIILLPKEAVADSNNELAKINKKLAEFKQMSYKKQERRRNEIRDLEAKACLLGDKVRCQYALIWAEGDQRLNIWQASCEMGNCPTTSEIYGNKDGPHYKTVAQYNRLRSISQAQCNQRTEGCSREIDGHFLSTFQYAPDVRKAYKIFLERCLASKAQQCPDAQWLREQGFDRVQNELLAIREIWLKQKAIVDLLEARESSETIALRNKASAKKSDTDAAKIFKKACDLGSAYGCANYVRSSYYRDSKNIDHKSLYPIAEKTCALGNSLACRMQVDLLKHQRQFDKAELVAAKICVELPIDSLFCPGIFDSSTTRIVKKMTNWNEKDIDIYSCRINVANAGRALRDARCLSGEFLLLSSPAQPEDLPTYGDLTSSGLVSLSLRKSQRVRMLPTGSYVQCADDIAQAFGTWLDQNQNSSAPNARVNHIKRYQAFIKKCGGTYDEVKLFEVCTPLATRPVHHRLICVAAEKPSINQIIAQYHDQWAVTGKDLEEDFSVIERGLGNVRGHIGPSASREGPFRTQVKNHPYFGPIQTTETIFQTVSAKGAEYASFELGEDTITVTLRREINEILSKLAATGEFVSKPFMLISGPNPDGLKPQSLNYSNSQAATQTRTSDAQWDHEKGYWVPTTHFTFDISNMKLEGISGNQTLYFVYQLVYEARDHDIFIPIDEKIFQYWRIRKLHPELKLAKTTSPENIERVSKAASIAYWEQLKGYYGREVPANPSYDIIEALKKAKEEFGVADIEYCEKQYAVPTFYNPSIDQLWDRVRMTRNQLDCLTSLEQGLTNSIAELLSQFSAAGFNNPGRWGLHFARTAKSEVEPHIADLKGKVDGFRQDYEQAVKEEKDAVAAIRLREARQKREAEEANKRDYAAEYAVYVQEENIKRMQQGLPPLGIGAAKKSSQSASGARNSTTPRAARSAGSGVMGNMILTVEKPSEEERKRKEEQDRIIRRGQAFDQWRQSIERSCTNEKTDTSGSECAAKVISSSGIDDYNQQKQKLENNMRNWANSKHNRSCKMPEYRENICYDITTTYNGPSYSCSEKTFDGDLFAMICIRRLSWVCSNNAFPADDKGQCPSVNR